MNYAENIEEFVERLDYLVSFTSQLILLRGLNNANKTQLLETYLEQFGSDAHSVYLRPGKNEPVAQQQDFLLRQIVRDAFIDKSKPLHSNIFKLLGEQPSQLLIVIDNAQNAATPIPNEMWNLILQNQFAHEKHHINVLIAGDDNWVNQFQKNLPHNGAEKPIVVDIPDDRSEEQHWFEEIARKKRDELQPPKSDNQLTAIETDDEVSPKHDFKNLKWFLKLSVTGSLVLFAGLLGLFKLYDLDSSSLTEFNSFLLQNNKTDSSNLSRYKKLMEPGESITNTTSQNTAESLTTVENELVGNWQELKKEPQIQAKKPDIIPETDDPNLFGNNALTQTILPQNIPQPLTTKSAQDSGSVNDNISSDVAVKQVAETNIEIPSLPFDNEQILVMQSNNFTLQLSGVSSIDVLEEFLLEYNLGDNALIYQTVRNNNPWWVVIMGEFDSLQSARQAVKALPQPLQDIRPWAKSLAAVHQEINKNS